MTPEALIQVSRVSLAVRSRPGLTLASLVVCDLIAVAIAGSVSVWLRLVFGGVFQVNTYAALWPILMLFICAFAFVGLYQGAALNPVEELRLAWLATTLMYLFLGSISFMFNVAEVYSRGAFVIAWLSSLVLVPTFRAFTRRMLAHQSWWGYPVVVLGAGETGRTVVRMLQSQPGFGLKPVAFLDDDSGKWGDLEGIPVLGGLDLAPVLAEQYGVRHALLAMPGAPRARLLEIIEVYGGVFPRLYLIPDLFGVASLWASARDLGGLLGLEVRQNLLLAWSRRVKRTIDLIAVFLGGVIALPVMVLIALAIKLESRGPVFYAHKRVGLGGKRFMAWKFRSMVTNADAVLAHHLANDPSARDEWARDHKLLRDPRVTRVGRLLRRTSLDELPQIWNVLWGEMSLVGPRPIVDAEISKYDEGFRLYARVLPGITGLWQVSGRSDTTYAERVRLDTYYVRNWSPWLDFYLLARTVLVVITARGAY